MPGRPPLGGMTDRYTRRRALQAGAVGVAFGIAGCSDGSDSDEDDEGSEGTPTATPTGTPTPTPPPETGPIGPIPETVTALARADADALLSGELLAELESTPLPGIGDASTALEDLESEYGLDPEAVSTLTAFQSTRGEGQLAGVVVVADWTAEDLAGVDAPTTTYQDRTIYDGESDLALGVLGGDQYAIGQRPAVQATIDVAAGEIDPDSGPVVTGLQNGPEGRARFAVGGSRISLPEGMAGGEGGLGAQLAGGFVEDISLLAGSLSADGDRRTLTLDIVATEESAADIANILSSPGVLRLGLSEEQRNDENVQTLLSAFESATVSQTGDTVRWAYTAPVAEFAATVRAGAALAAGGESGTSGDGDAAQSE